MESMSDGIVERAERALREFGITDRATAVRLLPLWAHYFELTPREAHVVLDRFIVEDDDLGPRTLHRGGGLISGGGVA